MSEEQLEYDPEWTLATLNDAKEALEDLIAQVEDSPEEVKEILEENIANVYAKLNYAFNSAKDGPDALLSMPDDELVAFPSVLPLKHKVEFEEEDEEKPEEVRGPVTGRCYGPADAYRLWRRWRWRWVRQQP